MVPYARRRDDLAAAVRAAGLDALLVAKPCNVSYLTGFTGDSSFLLVTPTRVVLVSDDRFRTQIGEECPGLDTNIRGHDRNTYQAVGDVVTRLGLRNVGVEASGVTLEAFEKLKGECKSATLGGTTGLVEKLREVKDETEIAATREAIRVAEQGFAALTATVRPTDTEKDLGDLLDALRPPGRRGRDGLPDHHRRRRAVGPAARQPERPPGRVGGLLLVDWGAREGLYHSDLTRVRFGPRRQWTRDVESRLERMYTVVLEAQIRAIAALRPGVYVKVVDAAARGYIADAGFGDYFTHGLGHGIGLEVHEAPAIRSNSDDVLQAGMVVTIEPGVYLPGIGRGADRGRRADHAGRGGGLDDRVREGLGKPVSMPIGVNRWLTPSRRRNRRARSTCATVRELVELMNKFDLSEVDLNEGDQRIRLREAAGVVAAAAPPVAPAARGRHAAPSGQRPAGRRRRPPAKKLLEIKSRAGRHVLRQAGPGQGRLREGRVAASRPDTVVCQVEAMKIFNDITAEVLRHHRRGVRQERRLRRVRPGPVPGRPLVSAVGRVTMTAVTPIRPTDSHHVSTNPRRQPRRDRPAGHPGLPRLGIEVVAVYCEADRGAPYLELADEAICIGPARAAESYLNIPRIIAAAEMANVAGHPPRLRVSVGERQVRRGVPRVQHRVHRPAARGDAQAGQQERGQASSPRRPKVPVVPGSEGLIDDRRRGARSSPAQIGYPVLIKAAAGGGGRGMRVARNDDQPASPGSQAARQEAEAAFKDGSVFLEKYLEQPRHVEVQILGDQHGNVVHLFERDCSLQRRHQKLVEESPAPNLPDEVREEMCEAAVRLAKAAGYYNAGTCEFLVDQENNFYFIEVNARIQVEHPVTELVTGIDLVREQIRIAAGEKLRVHAGGHRAARLRDRVPDQRRGPGERLPPVAGHDHDAGSRRAGRACGSTRTSCTGYRVPPNYDSLVAKLLVHQPTRAEAIAVMRRALREFVVEGIKTTIPIHQRDLRPRPRSSRGRWTRRSSNACSSARGRASRGRSRSC